MKMSIARFSGVAGEFGQRLLLSIPGSLSSILTAKRRSLVTMLGAAWGVMILVGDFTIIVGLEKENTRYIEEEGGMTYISLESSGTGSGLSLDEAASIASNSSKDFMVSPEVVVEKSAVSGPGRTAQGRVSVLGVSPTFQDVASFRVERGRFISAFDLQERTRVAVLGTDAEDALFRGEDSIGREIKVGATRYVVVGVMGHKSEKHDEITGRWMGQWKGMWKNQLVMIPFTTAAVAHNAKMSIDFRTSSLSQVADAMDQIVEFLQGMNRSTEDFELSSRSEEMQWIYSMVRRWKYGLYAMIILCLLMAGIGVANLMLVQVNERIREIGVRKAAGASNVDIFLHFLWESTSLSVIGGGLGIMLGIGLAKVVASLADLPYGFSMNVTAIGFIVSVILGIASGLAPAIKASKLNPVEALRYE